MKNTKYIYVSISVSMIVIVGVYFGLLSTITAESSLPKTVSQITSQVVDQARANPDYICIKQVSDGPCGDLTNPPWNGTQRTRTGRRITALAYVSTRVACDEAGYTCLQGTQQQQRLDVNGAPVYDEYGNPILDTVGNGICTPMGGASGASGRDGRADYAYSYGDSCSIVEIDTTNPDSTPTGN